MCALMAASPARGVERQVAAGVQVGVVSQMDATVLLDAYRLCWRLQAGARLLTDQPVDPAVLGESARAFLLRETGEAEAEDLTEKLELLSAGADRVVSQRLKG